MEEQAGSSPLFAVFVLSVFSLFLIPFTVYKLCVAAAPDEVVKPWESVSPSRKSRSRCLHKMTVFQGVYEDVRVVRSCKS